MLSIPRLDSERLRSKSHVNEPSLGTLDFFMALNDEGSEDHKQSHDRKETGLIVQLPSFITHSQDRQITCNMILHVLSHNVSSLICSPPITTPILLGGLQNA